MKNIIRCLLSGIFILTISNCSKDKTDTPFYPADPNTKKNNEIPSSNGGTQETAADKLAREAKEKDDAIILAAEFKKHKINIENIVKIGSTTMTEISSATDLAALEIAKNNAIAKVKKEKIDADTLSKIT